jgi:hypothetical protein
MCVTITVCGASHKPAHTLLTIAINMNYRGQHSLTGQAALIEGSNPDSFQEDQINTVFEAIKNRTSGDLKNVVQELVVTAMTSLNDMNPNMSGYTCQDSEESSINCILRNLGDLGRLREQEADILTEQAAICKELRSTIMDIGDKLSSGGMNARAMIQATLFDDAGEGRGGGGGGPPPPPGRNGGSSSIQFPAPASSKSVSATNPSAPASSKPVSATNPSAPASSSTSASGTNLLRQQVSFLLI